MSTDEQHRLPGHPGGTAGCPELAALTAAREVAPPSATALADVRAVLRAAVEREEEAAVVPATRPRLRGPRRWIVTGAAAAAVATGLAVLPVVDFGGGGTAADASAAAFLDETAQHAATGVQHSGKYWRVFTASLVPGTAEVRDVMFVDREKARDRILNPNKAGMITSWYSEYRGQWRWGTGRAVVTWDQLNQLPTSTAALRTRLTGTDFGETVRTVTDLLATSPASPKLRAALYRVLATTPGIRLDGAARDSRGRKGTSISVTYNEQFGPATARATEQLLIDPRTGVLLQEHLKIVTYPKGSQGRVQHLSTTTYLSSGWVDKLS
ncbi:hypothetical protein ACFO3J_17860 [Streptomyces polygonati]|uniref:CU044_5270 family protein n=1 Tax=Streptomyces polygonati TaxID=1617087 RepID=A0ABV8HR31_9ACTN